MKPDQAAKLLIGKTIKNINYYQYINMAMCIDEITFIDGTVIKMAGGCDEAIFDFIVLPDGSREDIKFEKAKEG